MPCGNMIWSARTHMHINPVGLAQPSQPIRLTSLELYWNLPVLSCWKMFFNSDRRREGRWWLWCSVTIIIGDFTLCVCVIVQVYVCKPRSNMDRKKTIIDKKKKPPLEHKWMIKRRVLSRDLNPRWFSLINQVKQTNSSSNPDLWEPFSSTFKRTP